MSEGEILSRQTPRSKVDGTAGASTRLLAFKRATRSNLEKVRSSETQSMDVSGSDDGSGGRAHAVPMRAAAAQTASMLGCVKHMRRRAASAETATM